MISVIESAGLLPVCLDRLHGSNNQFCFSSSCFLSSSLPSSLLRVKLNSTLSLAHRPFPS